MLYIETENKEAAFHFAVEEYIVQNYPWGEAVMMIWQTGKCAMLGSNQIAEAEIDMSFAAQQGMQIARRSSGGGTIYTDPGTLLYTVIMPCEKGQYPLETAKEKVAAPVVSALNELGVPALMRGRNDIFVDGKKISGFAQYVRRDRVCTHGSLLYDTDLEILARALRPDEEKIRSKAVRSVRSQVANIKEYMARPYSTPEFKELLKKALFCGRHIQKYALAGDELAEIDQIFQKKYGNPSWNFGNSPKFSFHNSKRFAGGKVEVYLDIDKGAVASCFIRGDFLGVSPIGELEEIFENKLFQFQVFSAALENISLRPYLGSITKDEFLSCIFT
jgi:lipoate-protein ligase A